MVNKIELQKLRKEAMKQSGYSEAKKKYQKIYSEGYEKLWGKAPYRNIPVLKDTFNEIENLKNKLGLKNKEEVILRLLDYRQKYLQLKKEQKENQAQQLKGGIENK